MEDVKEGPVLLLGEGNFSFTTAFMKKLDEGIKVFSTSYLNSEEVRRTHAEAAENIELLQQKGVEVLHSVDATRIHDTPTLHGLQFPCIIFNFPHIGGKSNIKKNRELMKNMFVSVSKVLSKGCDFYLTLAQGQGGTPADDPIREWHDSWQAVAMAAYSNMILSDVGPFCIHKFEGYSSTGFRSRDQHFFTDRARTHKFNHAEKLSVPNSSAVDVSRVPVVIQQNTYRVESHLQKYWNRDLLNMPGLPLYLVKQQIGQLLESFGNMKQKALVTQYADVVVEEKEDSCRKGSYCIGTESDDTVGSDDSKFYLRTTLLKNIEIPENTPEDSTIHILAGDVFRKLSTLNNNLQLPVQREMCGIFTCELGACFSVKDMRSHVVSSLEKVFESRDAQIRCSKCNGTEDELYPHQDCFDADDIWEIEVGFRTNSSVLTMACNQVDEKGPAAVPKNIPKFCRLSKHLGFVGKLSGRDRGAFVLNLDAIAMVKYDICDARLLWSENEQFLAQFKDLRPDSVHQYNPISRYPPLWRHDLSMWENKEVAFDEEEYLNIVRNVCGSVVRNLSLVNMWPEPANNKVSRCYRQVYQSGEFAISHQTAHQFQNALRCTVAKEMGVELR